MQINIVCGPPASGKSTYVSQHMSVGDLVIDLDSILAAISYTKEKSREAEDLLPVALGIRKYIYSVIDQSMVHAAHCWIIECLPSQVDRIELQERFDANLIELEVSREECIKRALNDPKRIDMSTQIYIIDKYFKKRLKE